MPKLAVALSARRVFPRRIDRLSLIVVDEREFGSAFVTGAAEAPVSGAPAAFAFMMPAAVMRLKAEPHRLHRAQVLMPLDGALLCASARGLWLVPPKCAIWIPRHEVHSIAAFGPLTVINVLLDTDLATDLPKRCCILSVPERLGELVIEAAENPFAEGAGSLSAHVRGELLDGLASAPVENLFLPMPSDPRLRAVVAAVMADPATRRTRADLAGAAGLSESTLDRGMHRETGLGYARWRQQFAITVALRMMAEGLTIQTIATQLGYDSPGGFIKMFRRVMGMSPARYARASI